MKRFPEGTLRLQLFLFQVSVAFTPNSTVPGEDIQMKVFANPGALCGLSVVDQSVLLLDPKNRLDADKVNPPVLCLEL